ncbi:hypothetical protein [Streptomyces sp. NPDC047315]|uniref:hypothetical protein n=1 Tax=Streptomyces sp. NPDC047315 TaxID=3155142 RepID=UPI0033C2F6EB
MPDYFDRLLARYTPVPAPGGAEGAGCTIRVRPRLPGPYERVEALRSGPQEPDEPASLLPSAPHSVSRTAEVVHEERTVRTDRHTVVRTETVRSDHGPDAPADAAATPGRGAPLPPPARRAPGPRAAPDRGPHAPWRPAAPSSAAGPRPEAADPAPRPAVPAPPAAPAPLGPRAADAAAARGAAPYGVGRRASKQAERVVHVQIGRLEVSAAPMADRGRSPAADRFDRTGRRAPALTLDDYLSRGEKGN